MKLINKLATAGAVAVMGLGLGAVSASANIALDNTDPTGAFTGTGSNHTFAAGDLTVTCVDATFTGNSNNATTTLIPFHAEYDDCTVDLAGIPLPALVTTNSDWDLDYASGSIAGNNLLADVIITPAGSGPAVQIDVPDFGCSIDIDAQSGLSSVAASNGISGAELAAAVSGIAYTTDCPLIDPSGFGGYEGDVVIPGVTITDVL